MKHVFTHMTLFRGSGYFVDKQPSYVLRSYVYETPEFVTEVVHGSTLYFKTSLSKCCNNSNARFLPCHFIFTHEQNINVFKMLSVKCEEIWPFDIREFNIKLNKETVNWIYVA